MRFADRLTTFFFLATIFSVSFQNVYWDVAGRVNLADIVAAPLPRRLRRRAHQRPRPFRARDGSRRARLRRGAPDRVPGRLLQPRDEAGALALREGDDEVPDPLRVPRRGRRVPARRSERFYWQTIGWFAAGFAANAAYGLLQAVARLGGRDLDALVLNPITGGAASLNIWGAVGESSVYRVNGLTGDANHLGVMLVVPLLMLTPLYLRLERGHRLKVPLAALLGFLLLVEIATLSRSGLLGLVAGGCCSPSCTGRSS